LDDVGPTPWDGGVVEAIETRYSCTCVITPNFVAIGQTVRAQVEVTKMLGTLGPRPLVMWAWLTH